MILFSGESFKYKSSKTIKSNKYTQDKPLKKHNESLDELSLVLSNISINSDPEHIDTNELLNNTNNKQKKNKSNKITLQFNKNINVDCTKYNIINKYIKKNINTIKDLLYEKKLIKNKDIPYRILFHIYVNYLNNDMKIVFDKTF